MTIIVRCPKCGHATHTVAIVNVGHLLLTCQVCAAQVMFQVEMSGEFDRLVDCIMVTGKDGRHVVDVG